MKEDTPDWCRRPREPANAYRGFTLYRGTMSRADDDPPARGKSKDAEVIDEGTWGPAEPVRDLHEIAKRMGWSYHTAKRYSSDYSWKERAAKYYEYIEKLWRDEIERGHRLKSARWLKIRDAEADRIRAHAEAIRAKLDHILNDCKLFEYEDTIEDEYPDGRAKTIRRVIRPVGWRLRDVALLAKTSAELMERAFRLVFGDAGDKPIVEEDDIIPPEIAAVMLKAAAELHEAGLNGDGKARSEADGRGED